MSSKQRITAFAVLILGIALWSATAATGLAAWVGLDIGPAGDPPLPPGSGVESPAGTFTVSGGGADIWNAADQFFFYYWDNPIFDSDFMLTARLTSMTGTNPAQMWQKAGLMFRNDLFEGSYFAFSAMSSGNGYGLQARPEYGTANNLISDMQGGIAAPNPGATPPVPPRWIRLVRTNTSTYTSYSSTDGVNWVQAGSPHTLGLFGSMAYFGIAVTSHDQNQSTTAVFDNVSFTALDSLTWNGTAGNWGDASRWLRGGSPANAFPTELTRATIPDTNANPVTVEADHKAFSLDVLGGSLTIGTVAAPAKTLSVFSAVNATVPITLRAGAGLSAGSGGTLATLNTVGNATVGVGAGAMNVATWSDGGVNGTLTKLGAGALNLNSTAAANTSFNVQAGTLKVVHSGTWIGPRSITLGGGATINISQSGTPAPGPADATMLGKWTFDTTGPSGEVKNQGTLGAAADGWLLGDAAIAPGGKVGSALSLNTINPTSPTGYVDVGNDPELCFTNNDWAIAAWVKSTNAGTGDANKGTIFGKGGDQTAGIRYAAIVSETNAGRVSLVVDDNGNNLGGATDPAGSSAYDKRTLDGVALVNDGPWHHVVAQRVGANLRIYVDGALDSQRTLEADYNLTGTEMHNGLIGAITDHRTATIYKYFKGQLDEVYLYKRALTPGEIAAMAGFATLDLSQFDVTVNGSATLRATTTGSVNVGPLKLVSGVLTTAGAAGGMIFSGTTIDPTATSVGVNSTVATSLNVINGSGATARFAKQGAADLVLDKQNVNIANTIFAAEGGRLILSADSAQTWTPVSTAALAVKGGEMVLTSKTGSNVAFDNALTVEGNGTLTAGRAGTVGGAGAAAVTLGSAGKPLTVNTGATATLRSTDSYTLNVAAPLAGAGSVKVGEGAVNLAAGGAAGNVTVSGGTVNVGANLSVVSGSISGGTVNTGANQVVVSNNMQIGMLGISVSGAGSPTFALSGANLATNIDNLALSGGTTRLSLGLPDLIGLWTFDNVSGTTVTNEGSAGGAANGTINGEAAVTADGKIGNGLTLNASGATPTGYVDVGNDPKLCFTNNSFTIAAWVKSLNTGAVSDANKGVIFGKGGDNANGIRYAAIVSENTEGVPTMVIDDNAAGAGDPAGSTTYDKRQTNATTAVTDGAWHHVVAMRDGASLKVYVDNAQEANFAIEADYNLTGTEQHPGLIGAIWNNNTSQIYKFFKGQIDEVYLYNRALSQEEVGQLFTATEHQATNQAINLPSTSVVATSNSIVQFDSNTSATLNNVTTQSGATLTFAGTPIALSVQNVDGAGSLDLPASWSLTANRIRQSQFSIGANATVTIRPAAQPNAADSTSRLGSLAIAGGATPTATLDLNNNSILIDYSGSIGTKLTDVTAQIRIGRNGKDSNDQAKWDGKGIITTTGRAANVVAAVDRYNLGAINNADLATAGIGPSYTTFAGQAVTPNTVLVKYTYTGDANLDGKVDGDDYSYWLNGFLNTTPGSVQGWLRGDFDYNGVIDGDDYTQWLNSFLFAGAPLDEGGAAPVPEPSTALLVSIAVAGALAYACRRRR